MGAAWCFGYKKLGRGGCHSIMTPEGEVPARFAVVERGVWEGVSG
jgi:hypothetical protein